MQIKLDLPYKNVNNTASAYLTILVSSAIIIIMQQEAL